MRLSVARRRLLVLALVTLAAALLAQPASALSNGVVISQVYGGGGNSGAELRQDYIELFNRGTSPVSLAGWSLQYASASGTGNFGSSPTQLTELPAVTIAPGRYYLVREAPGAGGTADVPADFVDPTPIPMGGTDGKVALVSSATSLGCNGGSTPCSAAQRAQIVDLVGYGTANFYEGSGAAPRLSNTTAAVRALQGCAETDDNAADFTAQAPAPRNLATAPHFCNAESAPSVVSSNPSAGASGISRSSNVTVTFSEPVTPSGDWLTVACTESGAHPGVISGGPTTYTLNPTDNFVFGETCTIRVDGDLVSDQDALDPPDTAADFEASFSVASITPIGTIQGVVTDTTNGFTFRSPMQNQNVVVRGVIYQLHRAGNNRGFFIQNTASTDDDHDLTSDGLFVFVGGFDTLVGGYRPTVGDEVILSGRVTEFFDFTQLSSPRLEEVVQSFVDIEASVPAFETDPPLDLADAYRYWERRESMRATIPAGSLTPDGTDRFGLDAEQWLMRADAPVADAANPFARRVFRDPHPLDDVVDQLFDNGNGYRLVIGAGGLKGAANDPSVVLTPLRTYQTITNALTGGVYFTFGKYAVQTGEQPVAAPGGIDPSTNNPPQPAGDGEYSVANYNVENLYDYRDDPTDGCDFAGNLGCPGVNPPFDYVPASEAVYEEHLGAIATQIVDDLHSPDIVLVQEAEDQDICTVSAGELVCGAGSDGKPDTLQEAALAIAAHGGPDYDAVYDRNGADDRGIVSAFMYRTDRVQLLAAESDHPVLGSSPQVEYRAPGLSYNTDVQNPKALNADLPSDVNTSTGLDGSDVFTRAPQVGLFRVWRNGIGNGVWTDIYAISNHFSSTPDRRVGQRTEQANYDAAIVEALGGGAPVLVGGDFNVFPRPDDPFAPGHPLFPSDQLGAFYEIGLEPMWERIAAEVPEAAYSYVFQGQTQTLDTQFLTESIAERVVQSRVAHINADFPADFPGDGARGASDHDPMTTRVDVPVTIASLTALLQWCVDTAQTDTETQAKLQKHLAKGQIEAFIEHTLDKTPKDISQSCSDALVSSARDFG